MIEFVTKLHIVISFICFVIYMLSLFGIITSIMQKYNLINKKKNRAETILAIIKIIIISLIPIFNILLAFVVIFEYEKFKEINELALLSKGFISEKTKD